LEEVIPKHYFSQQYSIGINFTTDKACATRCA